MAATATVTKVAINLLLNNGVSSTGSVRTLPVSLGKIDKDNIDLDKALALSDLVETCLTKSVYVVEKVEYSHVSN